MTPEDPTGGQQSGPIERITQPMGAIAESGPVRGRRDTWFGDTRGSVLRFLGRWAFVVFILVIAFLGRSVLLPFVFAGLIAYILAPVVQRMTVRANGTMRMPRGLAIIICYIVFLAAVTGFMFLLVPRLSRDVARLAHEAGPTAQRIDKEYVPSVARWLEERFPSLKVVKQPQEDQPIVKDIQPPPGTALVVTPMPDGEFALQLTGNGVDIKPTPDGGFHLQALETPPSAVTLEDKLRGYVKKSVLGLQSKLNDVVRVL